MTTIRLILFICCIALIGVASALPTTGAISDITSNNANITVTGVTGDAAWVVWGYNPNAEVWITDNSTPTAGTAICRIWGAPLTGSTGYYAKACDSSGCGNEVFFTTLPITPLPITTFGAGFNNITRSHFNIMFIAPALFLAYTNVMPATIFWGILLGMIVMGLWRRNRGVRLVSVLFVMISPLIMTSNIGLMIGIPLAEQALGQALLAAGIAGILLSFVKK